MSSKDLIQSGILELYALGLCSKEETLRVEEALRSDEQVKKEYDEVCEALNHLAEERRVEPPASLKGRLMEKIEASEQEPLLEEESADKQKAEVKKTRAIQAQNNTHQEAPALTGASLHNPRLIRYQWLAAASVILFFASAAINWELYKRMNYAEEEAAVLRNNNMLLTDENGNIRTSYELMRQQFAFLERKNIKAGNLAGTPAYPDLEALVFWDKVKGDVYLIANELKPLAADEQYQLWALDNGVPKDAGLLPGDFSDGTAYKLGNISSSQAFAITIEKKGGAPSPTLEKMVVFGKI
ncbi:MAG: anti-sigma factor [Bacteroidia bacterium]